MKTAILILAAGSSSRMGTSKQLLDVDGIPLLKHTTSTALKTNIRPVIVVLGANESEHGKVLASLPVEIVSNERWSSGMGSSLKAGLRHLIHRHPDLEAVIVMVCDQPMISSSHLQRLQSEYYITGKPIVCSHYAGTTGVPALFAKPMFAEILALPDSQGAKNLLAKNLDEVSRVEFAAGAMDLDTPEDYRNFISNL